MTKTTSSKQSELVALRGKWFKERTRLYDRETGLPTVAVLVDDLRGWLEERGSLSVLVFRPSSEGQVEEVWGWEAYDDLLLDFVRRLKAFQTDGIVPQGTFCLPNVRSDEIILFVSPEGGAAMEGPAALGQKAAELDQLIRGYLAERADLSARFRSFVGLGPHHEGPQAPRRATGVPRGAGGARPGHAADRPPGNPGRRAAPGRHLPARHPARLPAGLRPGDGQHDRHGGALPRPAGQRIRERRNALLARRAHGASRAARACLPAALARGGGQRAQPAGRSS